MGAVRNPDRINFVLIDTVWRQSVIMTYLIVDLEATCCNRGTIPRSQMEIIEIGAVALDEHRHDVTDEFCAFIKPVRNTQLTDFCTELTSIDQSMVDHADVFKEVLATFKSWIWSFDNPVFCSWGDYDRHQLDQDCRYHNVPYPFDHQHINIKKRFAKNLGLRKGIGLGRAIRHVGLSFEGSPHRGIDDAKNMARLSEYIFTN